MSGTTIKYYDTKILILRFFKKNNYQKLNLNYI